MLSDFLSTHAWLLAVVVFGLLAALLTRSLETLLRHRVFVLCLAAVVFVVGAIGMAGIRLDDSPERWMPKSTVKSWEGFDRHFRHSDSLVIATHFQGQLRDDDVKLMAAIHEKLADLDGVHSVIDVSRFTEPVTEDTLTMILKPRSKGAPDPYAIYRGVLFDNPRQWRPDGLTDANALEGRTLITYLEMSTGRNSSGRVYSTEKENEKRRQAVKEIYEILDAHQRDDVTYHLVGAIAIEYELERIARDIVWIILPLSLLLAFVALGTSFRSFGPIGVAIVAGIWSVTVLVGGIAWAGWTLNVVTVAGPTLMFVIIVATTVHFAHASSNPELSLQHTDGQNGECNGFVRWVAVPCLGAACTTGVGFLMLTFNELQPVLEMGVELYYGAVLAFLGAFLAWMLIPRGKPGAAILLKPSRLRALHDVVLKFPKSMLAIMLASMALLTFFASRIDLDADPFSFFHPKSKMAKTFAHVQQREFGMYLLDVALIPKREAGTAASSQLSPEQRAAARKFERTIGKRPEVRNIISTMAIRDYQESLTNKGSVAGALSIGNTFDNWLQDQANEGAIRVTFKVDDLGEGFHDLLDEVRAEIPSDEFDYVITGTAADVVVLGDGLIGGMVRGLMTAFVVMAGVCAVWFRSWRLTLIAVLPNVFPVLFVFGIMGLFGVPLNSGTAMVATIALGVALNDTVHFIMHYRGRKLEGEPVAIAVADTYAEIGRPIVLTSIVNCLGFSIFLLSEFRPMSDFGLLTGIAMIAALIGDLVLLPALLRVFDRDFKTTAA